ncbi:MAG: thioredoxin family protein [Methanothermobacter sp.]|nr:thioredoxin family protein [Methanothermobacter sp.]
MVKIEIFTAEPPCPGCLKLLELADKIKKEHPEVEVIKHVGPSKAHEKYNLTVVPAIVAEEGLIKIMGVCPSKKTMIAILKELGV